MKSQAIQYVAIFSLYTIVFKQILTHYSLKNEKPLKYLSLFSRAGNLLIRSFRSNQMSDSKRFAQIAQDKWATVSESLR